ncbi:MAG: hypothetical protein J5910_02430, partial [Lachnospiraceae bacterium]|nr:hypothetical protein [Lachnospiraceae bacterium]
MEKMKRSAWMRIMALMLAVVTGITMMPTETMARVNAEGKSLTTVSNTAANVSCDSGDCHEHKDCECDDCQEQDDCVCNECRNKLNRSYAYSEENTNDRAEGGGCTHPSTKIGYHCVFGTLDNPNAEFIGVNYNTTTHHVIYRECTVCHQCIEGTGVPEPHTLEVSGHQCTKCIWCDGWCGLPKCDAKTGKVTVTFSNSTIRIPNYDFTIYTQTPIEGVTPLTYYDDSKPRTYTLYPLEDFSVTPTVNPDSTSEWSDYYIASATATDPTWMTTYQNDLWTISQLCVTRVQVENLPETVAPPTAKTDLVYNGNEQTGVDAGKGYTIKDNTATDAGDCKAIATLDPGYTWTDGTTGDKEISWSIAPAELTSVGLTKTLYFYNGNVQKPDVTSVQAGSLTVPDTDYSLSWSNEKSQEVGFYTVEATATSKNFAGTATATYEISDGIAKVPTAKALMYNGHIQTGVEPGTGYSIKD